MMKKKRLIQVGILFAIILFVRASEEGDFVCRKLSDEASYGDKRLRAKTEVQGPPGERGVNGSKGEKGEKGEAGASGGQMDYERFNAKIEYVYDTLNVRMLEMFSRQEKLESEMKEMQKTIFRLKQVTCLGGVSNRKRCFRVIWFEIDLNYYDAQHRCRNIGCEVANIDNMALYNEITQHARMTMTGRYKRLHLASTFDSVTNLVTLSNGQILTEHIGWYPGAPFTGRKSFTQLVLGVRKDPESVYQGIHNSSPKEFRSGVVCVM